MGGGEGLHTPLEIRRGLWQLSSVGSPMQHRAAGRQWRKERVASSRRTTSSRFHWTFIAFALWNGGRALFFVGSQRLGR